MVRPSFTTAARFRSDYGRIADQLNTLGWLPNLLMRLSVGFMFFSGAVGKLGDTGKFIAMFNSLGIPRSIGAGRRQPDG